MLDRIGNVLGPSEIMVHDLVVEFGSCCSVFREVVFVQNIAKSSHATFAQFLKEIYPEKKTYFTGEIVAEVWDTCSAH